MVPGISLANKCQLLFGFAVVVILIGALSVPWVRSNVAMEEAQFEEARLIGEVWLAAQLAEGGLPDVPVMMAIEGPGMVGAVGSEGNAPPRPRTGAAPEEGPPEPEPQAAPPVVVRFLPLPPPEDATIEPFVRAVRERHAIHPERLEHSTIETIQRATTFRYARVLLRGDLPGAPGDTDAIGVLVVDRPTSFADGQRLRVHVFIIAAGLGAGLLAILVFYFILTKLILSPVRRLRNTVEKVDAGDLSMRSELKTGDEFEQLAETLNTMLDRVQRGQAQLEAINSSLDLKVDALAEDNLGLYESNRLKSEFLANVSHELRTPLNSIIGFAELLDEMAAHDAEADPKRERYLGNILTSGRALLDLINDLLDLAKIEAGRMEVTIESTSVADLLEGLLQVMRPQAEAKSIRLDVVVGDRIPLVETDPGKLQQILYNFLSNAIKFTPKEGDVRVSADRVTRPAGDLGVRIAVADTGPGIPEDMEDVVFEKFRQADAGHTREFTGTGLGLAICRELAELLGASVSFVSEPGKGATFYVEVPLTREADAPKPLMGG